MHPDFWLVLARVGRPFAIALLGAAPLTALISLLAMLGGAMFGGARLIEFVIGFAGLSAAFGALALPLLLAEELPKEAAESWVLRSLRGAYLLGIPAALLVRILQLKLGTSRDPLEAMMLFILYVGAPLAADRYGRFEGIQQRYSPWSLGTRCLFAVGLHLGVFWALVLLHLALGETHPDRLTPVSCVGLIGMIVIALWTAGLGFARERVDAGIDRLQRQSDEAARHEHF